MLLKIVTDFSLFENILDESAKHWNLKNQISQCIKKIDSYFKPIIYEQSKHDKKYKIVDYIIDPVRVNLQMNPKDKIWLNVDKELSKIEKYSSKLLVYLKGFPATLFDRHIQKKLFLEGIA